jgi:5'(3')-deoxyribonucleotidase
MRQRIAIDMDEVIADTLAKHVDLYNAEFGDNVTADGLRGKKLRDAVAEEHAEKLETFLVAEDFFGDLEVMPDSQRVVSELMERYEIFITTAAMEVPTSFAAKFRWLEEHFPFVPASNVVFCGDKSIIRADYLIDDNARHFRNFAGQGVLYAAPHNAHVEGYPRVESWEEVREMFL